MRSQYLTTLLLTFASCVQSLQFIPGQNATFPECGTTCGALVASQNACGADTPNLVAENCFCQRGEVQTIYQSPDTTCNDDCTSASDRVLVRNWFFQFCQQVGAGIDPLAGQVQQTTTTAATSTATASPTAKAGSPGSSTISNETGNTWFKHHWQWILMVVILAIGFLIIGFTARWYKKRYDLKHIEKPGYAPGPDSTRLSKLLKVPTEKAESTRNAATPDLWGPHQHMAATRDHPYDMERGGSPVSVAREGPYRSYTDRSLKSSRPGRVETHEVRENLSSNYPDRQQGGYGRF